MNAPEERIEPGPLAWMAANPVAANLLMAVILLGGVVTAFTLKQESFPELEADVVSVTVPYPGASPREVEQGIVLAVEEAVRGIDGVRRVTSVASEGMASVTIQLLLGADQDRVVSDVTNEVNRITTIPLDAEEPTISAGTFRPQVISLIFAGDQDLKGLGLRWSQIELLASNVDGAPMMDEVLPEYSMILVQELIGVGRFAADLRLRYIQGPGIHDQEPRLLGSEYSRHHRLAPGPVGFHAPGAHEEADLSV